MLALLAAAWHTALSTGTASADDAASGAGWIMTLGGYGTYAPRFEGARAYGPQWRPIFNFRSGDGKDWLDLPSDGFGIELVETDWFRFGPVVDGRLERHVATTCLGCRHFGAIDLSIEAGAFAEVWPMPWLRTRVEVKQAVIGGSGLVGDLSADVVLRPAARLLVAAGPRLSLADHAFMQLNYGVNTAEAAALESRLHEVAGGLRSLGLGGYARYKLDDAWSAHSYVEWERLANAARESPRIAEHGSGDAITGGIGLSYSFSIGR